MLAGECDQIILVLADATSDGQTSVPSGANRSAKGPSDQGQRERQVSFNFSVAKVAAIFMVIAGHWFADTILWLPATFGLFVFAFSSSYFTSQKYGVRLDTKRFWRSKLERLALRYWVILGFVAVVAAGRGHTIVHWHTLAHFLGLSGLLNWFAIPNRSGLGAGLWFFTLLLLFYLAFPYLARVASSKSRACVLALVSTLAAIYLESHVKLGHELWLTSLGFVLGVAYGAHEPRLNAQWASIATLLACAVLIVGNLSGHKGMNPAFIAIASIAIAVWLSKAELPRWKPLILVSSLENYLLEVFLIHTYLFFNPTGRTWLDFAISLGMIVTAAIALGAFSSRLSPLVFRP